MNIRTPLITTGLIAASLVSVMASGIAHAELQGRDLNGSAGSFEAYYDTDLNITWLADANYAKTSGYDYDGVMNWTTANTWAAQLNINGYDNWRLPTVEPVNGSTFNYNQTSNGSTDAGWNITSPQSEMSHLFYVTLGNPGSTTPAGVSSGCFVSGTDTCLNNVGPFNFQANYYGYYYWSATEYPLDTNGAWAFGMNDGVQGGFLKSSGAYALAVSPGDVAAVPEAETYALMLAGLGLVGWRARRRG